MINYVTGDATDPRGPGNRVIAHVCNDVGAWGRGFVMSLSQRWPKAEQSYRRWYQEQGNDSWPLMRLSQVVFVPVGDGVVVANMIGQHGILPKDDGTPPIRYGALANCLIQVGNYAREWDHASVHMPRIGCGLAGGSWNDVEPIIVTALIDVDTYVYDLALDRADARCVPWRV